MNKCVDVLVGLQYGSEGKGKIAALLARKYKASVRVGAPNAGHTIWHNGVKYKMRSIPCAWINPECRLYIGAGGMVNVDVLMEELNSCVGAAERLIVDEQAVVVTKQHAKNEEHMGMFEKVGSTNEGIGQAQCAKISRMQGEDILAKSVKELTPYTGYVQGRLFQHIMDNDPILIEGTQGYGLCLDHGYYPFVTSRNVIAASMLSDCGIAPNSVRNVIGVMRTYPIRVYGNSGPMGAEELEWDDVRRLSGAPPTERIQEVTTVTNRVRRVSRINWDLLWAAVQANGCTSLAIMFMDYINYADRGCRDWKYLSQEGKEFVAMVVKQLGVPVSILSTGPKPEDTIFLGNED